MIKKISREAPNPLRNLGLVYCTIGCVGGALLGIYSLGIVGLVIGIAGGSIIGLVVKKFI